MANNQNNNNNSAANFLVGVIVGSVVGAATALLLAPKSGRELRSDINQQVGTLKEKSGEWKDTVVEKSSEISAVAKEKSEQIRQVAAEKAEIVKEKATQLRNVVKNDGWKETVNENEEAQEGEVVSQEPVVTAVEEKTEEDLVKQQ